MISSEMLGCSTARNKGTCDNRTNMRRDELEVRVLAALRHHPMEPALFAEFCEEFTREINRIRSAGSETLETSGAEIKKIDRDLGRLVDMVLRGGAADRLNERMVRMEARKRELESVVAEGKEPAPVLHPRWQAIITARSRACTRHSTPDRRQSGSRLRTCSAR